MKWDNKTIHKYSKILATELTTFNRKQDLYAIHKNFEVLMQNSEVLMLLLILKRLTLWKSVLHRHISFTWLQFNTLCWTIGHILFQFNHLLILWTSSLLWYCCLLLLVRIWLRLGALELVLADAVVDWNSSQGSNDECNGANDHCRNAYSSTCADDSICAESGLCRDITRIYWLV